MHPDPFEVLSPFTQNRDKKETLEVYESVGVKEYWIVDPFEDKVCVYHLKNTTTSEPPQYSLPDSYRFADKIPVGASPGLTIELSGV